MEPGAAPNGDIYDAADYRRSFPDGRIVSNPAMAESEHGEIFMQVAVDDLAKLYREFVGN